MKRINIIAALLLVMLVASGQAQTGPDQKMNQFITNLMSKMTLAAEVENRIIGFVSLDSNHSELDFLYVHPDFARQGLGRQLCQEIECEAKRCGVNTLELTASLNAVRAYERLGYRKTCDMVKTIDGVAVPCVRMSKRLS